MHVTIAGFDDRKPVPEHAVQIQGGTASGRLKGVENPFCVPVRFTGGLGRSGTGRPLVPLAGHCT